MKFKKLKKLFKQKTKYTPALCMTCGARENPERDFCASGHDNWLCIDDVQEENQFFTQTLLNSGLTKEKFLKLYYEGKSIKLVINDV